MLAPAGQVESFWAAVENGANAVYLGLKQLSARASATNFSLEELAVLLPFAHKRKVSIYVAVNSLLTAADFPRILDLLQSLADLKVDALIVQDPGIFFLARQFFPSLRLHASTLMTIHNHAGVSQLGKMGARRVVLARELDLEEISDIAGQTAVELEIFVHGALCYSYSGLCLASSFRGGHSGLQGRCVQPCRLQFRQGRKEGFFLSCNDLCLLSCVPQLKKLRLAAFKIEGRMKSADYIAQVVRAYRLVLDASPQKEAEALLEARELLARSPSRRLTLGYLAGNASVEILSPHRSGSSGQWVGTVKRVDNKRALVVLRHDLRPGDRLRPEASAGKERQAFTVSAMFSDAARPISMGRAGEKVLLAVKSELRPGERLIRVGAREKVPGGTWQRIRSEIPAGEPFARGFRRRDLLRQGWPEPAAQPESGESLMVKISHVGDLAEAFQSQARWVLLSATRTNLERLAKHRFTMPQKQRFGWSLPPLIAEKDDRYYRLAVSWFCERGFRSWELNNWGHFDFFPERESLNLMAGCRFNVRNPGAMAELALAGCRWSVLSLEITREELQLLAQQHPHSTIPVITLYSWPPLFTSRLVPKLEEGRPFRTPREETYFFEKRGGSSLIFADTPVSWLNQLAVLRGYGYQCFLLDRSDGPAERLPSMERLLHGYRASKAEQPFSLFNFDRRPW